MSLSHDRSHDLSFETPAASPTIYREEVDRVVKELKLKLLRTSVKENFNVEAGIYHQTGLSHRATG